MQLNEITKKLNLNVRTASDKLDIEVTGGYASDLLSDVMANAIQGNIWVTLQTHQNVVAVAVLRDLSGIIIVNGRKPDEETLKKAEQEKIPIMMSNLPTFELVGRLYKLGVFGVH
jgi:predicted transcriptional regulator